MQIDFSQYAGLGIVAGIIWLVATVILIILGIWIQYTVIWHAVRRGLREYHQPGGNPPPAN